MVAVFKPDGVALGAWPVLSNDCPTCESSDVADDGLDVPDVEEASAEPTEERPLMEASYLGTARRGRELRHLNEGLTPGRSEPCLVC